jgi:hypothetical protein
MAIGKLKRYKSPGIGHIPTNSLKQKIEECVMRRINLLNMLGIKRNCLSSELLCLFIRRAIKQIILTIEAYYFCQLYIKFNPAPSCQSKIHTQRKLLGIVIVGFDVTGQLLIIYSAFVKYLRKKCE